MPTETWACSFCVSFMDMQGTGGFMASSLLLRAAVVIVAGAAAGAVHAHFRQQSTPLVLRAKEAEKLDLTQYAKPTHEPISPTNDKPGDQQPPSGAQPAPPPPVAPPPPPPKGEEGKVGLHITIEQAKLLY